MADINLLKALMAPLHLRKAQAEQIAAVAARSPTFFKQLLGFMFSDNITCSKRAAWCFSLAALLRPEWTLQCQKELVTLLEKENLPDGTLRNTLRILRDGQIQPAFFDRLAYHCFNLVEDPNQAIAIRAFAMRILGDIGTTVPDIRGEVRAIIEYYFTDQAPPGLVSSAKAVLNLWKKTDNQSKSNKRNKQ